MPLTRNGGESLLEQVQYALKPWLGYARESAHSANRNTEGRLESVADRAWSKRLNSVEYVERLKFSTKVRLSIDEHHKLTPVSSEIRVRAEQVKRLDDRLREQ